MREICTRFSYFELNIFNTPESPNVNDFLLSVCLCQWRHNVTYLFDLNDLLDNRKNKHRQARHRVQHHWDDASGAGSGADNPGNWVSWSCRGTAYHFRCERCSAWTLLGPYCQQRNKRLACSARYLEFMRRMPYPGLVLFFLTVTTRFLKGCLFLCDNNISRMNVLKTLLITSHI